MSGLRKRFLTQSLTVLLVTILITACAGLLFGHFYCQVNLVPNGNSGMHADVVVLKEQEVIYASNAFGEAQVQEICMHWEMQHDHMTMNRKQYAMETETFRVASGATYHIIQITPVIDIVKEYRNLMIFVISVFLLTFIIASYIVQKENRKQIIEPLVHLKEATEELTQGQLQKELPEEGEGEIYELHEAIEQLRIKLKDSVYYERKFDENRQFLVSSISHDLKTPVTAIRGYIEGVLDGVAATEEKKRDYLENALQKTELMRTMIDDLLLYSKLDLHQVVFEPVQVDIAEYLTSCVEDFRFAFEKEGKRLCLQNELQGSVSVMIDVNRFHRVIQNILDNAKKNIKEESGQTAVCVRRRRHHVIVEIADNGIGIQKEELPHIFDRFYRADSARKIHGSSGLGLAIAKQMVETMHGHIWATSTYGEGTQILISLPIVREEWQNQKEKEK